MPQTTPELEIDATSSTGTDEPPRVILYNDSVHTFDDVINQLIKAIGCSRARGEEYAWEVHTKGKACVYTGEMPQCLRVSAVLEEISLHTQIEM